MRSAGCYLLSLVSVGYLWLLACANGLIQVDISRDQPRHLLKRSSDGEDDGAISLDNAISYYRAVILIGTPSQPVSVQIDTGSSDLWVISTNNPLCNSHFKCPHQAMFDSQRSSTFHRNDSTPFSIAYGDSTYANGTFAQDTIHIGGSVSQDARGSKFFSYFSSKFNMWRKIERRASQGLTLLSANFGLAETSNSTEAVWGIGMESTESMARNVDAAGNASPTYPNIPVQMKQQGLIETVAYSLWLNDLNSSQGSLLFGGVDHAKYVGSLQTVPLVSTHEGIDSPIDFSVMVHGISAYNSKNKSAILVESSVPFLLDSGTTYSQMPTEFLDPIIQTIGGIMDDTNQVYVVTEEQRELLGDGGLKFNLSGVIIDVSFNELLIPVSEIPRHTKRHQISEVPDTENIHLEASFYEERELNLADSVVTDMSPSQESIKARKKIRQYYLVGIYPASISNGGVYILGDTFLRSAYVVYDLEGKEISLANTNYNATKSIVEKIGSDGVPSASRAPLYYHTQISNEVSTHVASSLFATTTPKEPSSSAMQPADTTQITQLPLQATGAGALSSLATRTSRLPKGRERNGAKPTTSLVLTPIFETLLAQLLFLLI